MLQYFLITVGVLIASADPMFGQEDDADQEKGCSDNHDFCCFWASQGECDKNIRFMRSVCQKSCGCCGCTPDTAASCVPKVNTFGCKWISGCPVPQTNCNVPKPQPIRCGKQISCGQPQPIRCGVCKPQQQPQDCCGGGNFDASGPAPSPTFPGVGGTIRGGEGNWGNDACRDWSDQCSQWALTGECMKNGVFMNVMCKKSCGGC